MKDETMRVTESPHSEFESRIARPDAAITPPRATKGPAEALIADDLGHTAAITTARHLVMFMKRPGGQAQFSVPLAAQAAEDTFASLHAWMRANLTADLRVEALAQRAAMSPRHFARIYRTKVGRTPGRMVEEMRIEAARRSLEDTGLSVKRIARDCGFGDEERMRRSFIRQLGVAPSDYRARFAASSPPPPAPA